MWNKLPEDITGPCPSKHFSSTQWYSLRCFLIHRTSWTPRLSLLSPYVFQPSFHPEQVLQITQTICKIRYLQHINLQLLPWTFCIIVTNSTVKTLHSQSTPKGSQLGIFRRAPDVLSCEKKKKKPFVVTGRSLHRQCHLIQHELKASLLSVLVLNFYIDYFYLYCFLLGGCPVLCLYGPENTFIFSVRFVSFQMLPLNTNKRRCSLECRETVTSRKTSPQYWLGTLTLCVCCDNLQLLYCR